VDATDLIQTGVELVECPFENIPDE
jgi:hypothetical protein